MLPRVSILCPFCHQHTSVDTAPVRVDRRGDVSHVPALWEGPDGCRWWIGVCNSCQGAVLVRNEGDLIHPSPVPEPTDDSVPANIRADLDEAKQCFAVSASRATAVLARRAMQSAAMDKGATKDKLRDQIAELAASGKITTDLKDWADAVRWTGNDAAHPGGEAVTKEDAEDALKLAEQFLHVLYVTPAIAKSLRARRGE